MSLHIRRRRKKRRKPAAVLFDWAAIQDAEQTLLRFLDHLPPTFGSAFGGYGRVTQADLERREAESENLWRLELRSLLAMTSDLRTDWVRVDERYAPWLWQGPMPKGYG